MPVINCPECGGKVSKAAAACPHCGHPMGPPPPTAIQQQVVVPKKSAVESGFGGCMGIFLFIIFLVFVAFVFLYVLGLSL